LYVRKNSDAELHTLLEAVQDEITKRKDARKRRRTEWIDSHINKFYAYCGKFERVGDTIIVAYFNPSPIGYGVHMGRSTPINGDTFDLDTGLAVAFAKAMGERIPDFI
jgi:hypothetical protein